MIKEEYDFDNMEEYLSTNIDLFIAGEPTKEERSVFLVNLWREKPHLLLTLDGINRFKYTYTNNSKNIKESSNLDIPIGLPILLKKLSVKNINLLLDISSLDHVLIMVLVKQLIKNITPRSLFAIYIRPRQYLNPPLIEGLLLSEKIHEIKSVPGFAKREAEEQTLCSFIGFEGIRLKPILETANNISKIIPIVAFPSGGLHWFKLTMWHSMDILESETRDVTIYKCFSESIFDAVALLNELCTQTDGITLAPLGTRPHSVAAAIFATKHPSTKIIYDYAIERENRTKGISNICVYHLSSFIEIP